MHQLSQDLLHRPVRVLVVGCGGFRRAVAAGSANLPLNPGPKPRRPQEPRAKKGEPPPCVWGRNRWGGAQREPDQWRLIPPMAPTHPALGA